MNLFFRPNCEWEPVWIGWNFNENLLFFCLLWPTSWKDCVSFEVLEMFRHVNNIRKKTTQNTKAGIPEYRKYEILVKMDWRSMSDIDFQVFNSTFQEMYIIKLKNISHHCTALVLKIQKSSSKCYQTDRRRCLARIIQNVRLTIWNYDFS